MDKNAPTVQRRKDLLRSTAKAGTNVFKPTNQRDLKSHLHLKSHASVVTIGEIGLDTKFPDTLVTQISVFISFLKIAERYQKTLQLMCTGAHHL